MLRQEYLNTCASRLRRLDKDEFVFVGQDHGDMLGAQAANLVFRACRKPARRQAVAAGKCAFPHIRPID